VVATAAPVDLDAVLDDLDGKVVRLAADAARDVPPVVPLKLAYERVEEMRMRRGPLGLVKAQLGGTDAHWTVIVLIGPC
jgi:hypothetical protein